MSYMQYVHSKRRGAPKPPEGAIYVGRPTQWGNPYLVKDESDRDHSVLLYAQYALIQMQKDPHWADELKGKHLVCWCVPKLCHAMVLACLANEPDGVQRIQAYIEKNKEG